MSTLLPIPVVQAIVRRSSVATGRVVSWIPFSQKISGDRRFWVSTTQPPMTSVAASRAASAVAMTPRWSANQSGKQPDHEEEDEPGDEDAQPQDEVSGDRDGRRETGLDALPHGPVRNGDFADLVVGGPDPGPTAPAARRPRGPEADHHGIRPSHEPPRSTSASATTAV